MKCTVNQMQSTASLLSGGVIEILLANAYVSCLALYRTFPLPCRNFNLSATGAEKAARTDHQTQMQIHLCLSSQARVNQTEDLHRGTFKYSRPEILKHKEVGGWTLCLWHCRLLKSLQLNKKSFLANTQMLNCSEEKCNTWEIKY